MYLEKIKKLEVYLSTARLSFVPECRSLVGATFVRYASYEQFAQHTIRISTTKLRDCEAIFIIPVPLSRHSTGIAAMHVRAATANRCLSLLRYGATSLKRFGRVSRSYLLDALLLPVYILQRADRHLN